MVRSYVEVIFEINLSIVFYEELMEKRISKTAFIFNLIILMSKKNSLRKVPTFLFKLRQILEVF